LLRHADPTRRRGCPPSPRNFEALLAETDRLGVPRGTQLHLAPSQFHHHLPAKRAGQDGAAFAAPARVFGGGWCLAASVVVMKPRGQLLV
jgi:hypothetical protein